MARDTSDDTPITSRHALIERLESGSKPPQNWRIGTEHEKVGFRKADRRPVPYEGQGGIRQLLEGMEGLLGWEPILDDGRPIGLVDPTGGGAISLEPGGQFELSGAPVETLHQTCSETHAHMAQVRQIADPLGIGFLTLGASPVWSLAETPVMPKSRYRIMTDYMPKVGSRGLDMMYRTATVQVNLDFASEADMVKKMRVSVALQPIATALFANSPFLDGRPTGRLSERSEIWRDTDNARAGMIPFVFEDGYGFERYVDWALDVPMYFVKRERYHPATHVTFRQYLDGALRDELPGVVPTRGDWDNHLSTLFPEVRLKRFLEMRGADTGSLRRILALPAFWVGLLYDATSLDAAYDLVKDWSTEERQTLRDRVPTTALATPFRSGTVLDLARRAVALSREGLARRARLNSAGADETVYLAPVEETLALGRTQAEILLDRYRTSWDGSLEPVFADHVY
ncbi:glutamate--cysteine ligase [Chthonobacter rhizosphaerae]|uniref:glutamate--cysteine ligase n=1 Tax=Chthonobacter rhizosphaerae TaxID=2735553 RepID=UPI0015EF60C2|nr:glutamate--cysteine ligase [Chthonobacter rhizosphaerae]